MAACACALAVALGQWQSGRAVERRAALARLESAARAPAIELRREEAFDAAALARKRIAVRGEFVPRYTVLLDHRLHRGRPGYHVVQPLRLAGSDHHVIVLRGWLAAPPNRLLRPALATPPGEVRIEGIALRQLPQFLEPASAQPCTPGPELCVWQNLQVEKFAAWSGIAVAPLILEQANALEDGLNRSWERVEAGHLKNEMYALQWYSLAALSVVLFLVLSFRRAPRNDESA